MPEQPEEPLPVFICAGTSRWTLSSLGGRSDPVVSPQAIPRFAQLELANAAWIWLSRDRESQRWISNFRMTWQPSFFNHFNQSALFCTFPPQMRKYSLQKEWYVGSSSRHPTTFSKLCEATFEIRVYAVGRNNRYGLGTTDQILLCMNWYLNCLSFDGFVTSKKSLL